MKNDIIFMSKPDTQKGKEKKRKSEYFFKIYLLIV